MAELSTRYATALFELSSESGKVSEWAEQAALIRDTMQTDECRSIIEHPHISFAEKCGFLDKLFKKRIDEDLIGFLHLALSKGRDDFIVPALTSFIKMANVHKTEALVVSASELTKKQISLLTSLLSKKLNKQVEISSRVDPALIGGLYIQVDGYLIDCTVIKRFSDIKNSVKRGASDDTQA